MEFGLRHLSDEDLTDYVEESRRFNAARAAAAGDRPRPDPTTPEGLQQARDRTASVDPLGRPMVERLAQAGGRQVPVRVIAPEQGQIRGVYLDIPGGAFYLSQAARSDARNASLADALGVAVVTVDYRLAPEDPWPAATDDCETAAAWLVEQAGALFGTARLAIGGGSAGANLAMTSLFRLRDRGLAEHFAGVLLQFGTYDLSGRSPGGRLYADEFFIKFYAGSVADRTNPDISPLYGDLSGLPPALIIVGALDSLLEDNLAMAARLSAAGGEVDVRVYPESTHGFTSHPTAMAAAATRGIESWLAGRLIGK
jgi:acetyl esterase/lipase